MAGRSVRVFAVALLAAWTSSGIADAASTRLVTVAHGQVANGRSWGPSISAHGRLIAFTSRASNLVAGDTNRTSDVFVRNMRTHRTFRVSLAGRRRQANRASRSAIISDDGRFVAFTSDASNLLGRHRDRNHSSDVFVRDLVHHRTELVSVGNHGQRGDANSWLLDISGTGRFVVFGTASHAFHPLSEDQGVFIRDRARRRTIYLLSGRDIEGGVRVSDDGRLIGLGTDGFGPDAEVLNRRTHRTQRLPCPAAEDCNISPELTDMSPDGRYAVGSTNTETATDFFQNVIRWNRRRSRVRYLTHRSSGREDSWDAHISGDGRSVVFASDASLVPDDTNAATDAYRVIAGRRAYVRVDVSPTGAQLPHGVVVSTLDALDGPVALSRDGRYVAFRTTDALVRRDRNAGADIYLRGPL